MFLRNIAIHITEYTVPKPNRKQYETSAPLETTSNKDYPNNVIFALRICLTIILTEKCTVEYSFPRTYGNISGSHK
jgi:hypothetical protein